MFRRKKPANELNRAPQGASDGSEHRALRPQPQIEPAEERESPHRLPPAPPARAEVTPRRPVDIPGHPRRTAYATGAFPSSSASQSEGKKLIVGRDISLSGNIAACEKLIVEGTVEADVFDAHIIEVAEAGTFKGQAELEEADISGRFEGSLTVRNELRIRSTGIVKGTVRYARLVVEGGGRIVGSVEVLDGESAASATPAAEQPAPSRPVAASLPTGTDSEPEPASD